MFRIPKDSVVAFLEGLPEHAVIQLL